jgi:hypothetical protein
MTENINWENDVTVCPLRQGISYQLDCSIGYFIQIVIPSDTIFC